MWENASLRKYALPREDEDYVLTPDRRAGFAVVDEFERRLAEFCGASYCVAVDSCTNAIFLSLMWQRPRWSDGAAWLQRVSLPKHTYVGVAHAVWNAGLDIDWRDEEWEGSYKIDPLPIVDAAKTLWRGMYASATPPGMFVCLSFHWSKLLPIGRGGVILLDDPEARDWLRSARIDGRREGESYETPVFKRQGWHCNLHGDDAARGLHLLTYLEDDDPCDWTAYPDLSVATWS